MEPGVTILVVVSVPLKWLYYKTLVVWLRNYLLFTRVSWLENAWHNSCWYLIWVFASLIIHLLGISEWIGPLGMHHSLHWRHNDHDGVSNHQPVYSTVYSDADQRKHQSSVPLAFVWGIHQDRWIPRTKGQLRGKCFHLMTSSWFMSRTVYRTFVVELITFNLSTGQFVVF